MNRNPISVLLIEDNPGDVRLIREMAAEGKGRIGALECVESLAAGLRRIGQGGIDVVLLDLGLPDSAGLDTLRRLRAGAPHAPAVVVMSGISDEEVGMEAVQEGAQDYLVKGQVGSGLLIRSIRYAIERSEAEKALRRARDELESQVRERTASLTQAIESLEKENAERRMAEEALFRAAQVNLAAAELSRTILSPASIDDISYRVLEHAKRLTGSEFGFVGYIDRETGYLVVPTHTREIWDTCRVAHKDIVFKKFTGLWGWVLNNRKALLTNAPADDPRSSGTPSGHVPIRRFLSLPSLIGETLVGQVSVANADHDYGDRELQVTKRLADLYAIALQRRQAEKELKSHRDQLEGQVRKRTVELEASNKELEGFVYSISHDLRAPLRHIDGFLELLQMRVGTALDQQSRHYMDTISEAACKMGQLVDDLLSFSRMGRHAVTIQQVDLGSLVRDILSEFEPDTRTRNIGWSIGDLPVVSGDKAMVRIVLLNLISNAVKFTRPRARAKIEIGRLRSEETETVIFIRDNGVGFDMAYGDKLFGVFQRLHRQEEFEGIGIGLANVRRIIARHGGRTWAEGEIDHGATFYFSLPRPIQGE